MTVVAGRRLAPVLALVLAAGLGAGPVAADPVDDDDVQAARAAVDGAAATVAGLELELAVQQSALDAAWQAVAVAGEAHTQALVDAETTRAASEAAGRAAAEAQAAAEAARADLAAIALEAYRSGGSLDSLGALLSADGLDDLVARTEAIDALGDRAQRAVQRVEAAELVAGTLQRRADEAADEAAAAASRTAETLEAAEAAQACAEDAVATTEAERETLIVQLAGLRQVAVETERARQDQLDAERRARADAAARSDREQTPTTPVPGPTTQAPATPAPGVPTPTPTTPAPTTTTPAPTTPAPTTPAPTTPAPTTPAPAPTTDPFGLGTGSQRGSAAQGQSAVAWAQAQVGKAYSYGASGPSTFDCSGLTMRSWQAAGVSINRTSRDQYRQVRKIAYGDLRPGDLIFWGSNPNDPSSVYHVAIYVGGGQMVEAPRPGLTVRQVSVRWASTMAYAGRP